MNKNQEHFFEGGYFIYQNEYSKNNYANQLDLKVTLPENHGIKNTIISLIHKAEKSIKLCSFILSDPEIYSELNAVLNERKVAVFILTQLDNAKLSTHFLTEEEVNPNFYQKHIDYISKLYTNGAHIRAATKAHAKFLIIDDNEAIVMSANITTPSLNENPESGVFVKHKESLKSLISLFDVIYQYGTEYTKFKSASKNKQFVVSRDANLNKEWLKQIDDYNIKYTWANDNQSLYLEIINLINKGNVNSEILISTYSVVGLDNIPEFTEALKKYIEKGGEVLLFCRGMNYRSDHLSNCTKLAKIGVRIFGDLFNHSKGIISNNKGFIFTANIDGNHGLTNGFEIGYYLNDNQRNCLNYFISWQIENAPFIFKLNPTKNEFFETYKFYTQEKGIKAIDFPEQVEFLISNRTTKLQKELEIFPIYLHCNSLKKVEVINVGNSFYYAKMVDNVIEVFDKVFKSTNREVYLLQSKKISIKIKHSAAL